MDVSQLPNSEIIWNALSIYRDEKCNKALNARADCPGCGPMDQWERFHEAARYNTEFCNKLRQTNEDLRDKLEFQRNVADSLSKTVEKQKELLALAEEEEADLVLHIEKLEEMKGVERIKELTEIHEALVGRYAELETELEATRETLQLRENDITTMKNHAEYLFGRLDERDATIAHLRAALKDADDLNEQITGFNKDLGNKLTKKTEEVKILEIRLEEEIENCGAYEEALENVKCIATGVIEELQQITEDY